MDDRVWAGRGQLAVDTRNGATDEKACVCGIQAKSPAKESITSRCSTALSPHRSLHRRRIVIAIVKSVISWHLR
jgi:hypothetical protein